MGRNGEPRIGVRDVAKRAGVAMSTVSRVLSGHPNVSPGTRERVLAAVAELGYAPNAVGQMLRRGSTSAIGFAVSDISNPLFAQIALGAEAVLNKNGYSVVLTNSRGDRGRELDNLRALDRRRVDGFLLSVTTEDDAALISTLERLSGPAVAIDRDISPSAVSGAVCSDHGSGLSAAFGALHEAGHRHVVLAGGLAALRPGRERVAAARRVSAELGMRCTLLMSEGFEGPRPRQLSALLLGEDAPTAVVAGNNQALGTVLDVTAAAGLASPGDVSLVACDEVPMQRFLRPPLAVVRRDPEALGRESARMLLAALAGDDTALRQRILPTEFVPAASISPPRAGRPAGA